MNKEEIVKKLKSDENYYGDYGKQFLSNSDISTLLKNPRKLHEPKPRTPAFLVGGYFHTAILEPNKLKSFKIVEATTRNTKKYKEIPRNTNKYKEKFMIWQLHNRKEIIIAVVAFGIGAILL